MSCTDENCYLQKNLFVYWLNYDLEKLRVLKQYVSKPECVINRLYMFFLIIIKLYIYKGMLPLITVCLNNSKKLVFVCINGFLRKQ